MAGRVRHVAIIMDGNGRWAQKRGYPRVYGHVRGTKRVKEIVKAADRLGVEVLTLYAFSTENWARPESELSVLWKLLKKYLLREVQELNENNVCFRVIGEVDRLAPDVKAVVDMTVDKLKSNTGLQLVFALSYGSRRELADSCRKIATDCQAGKIDPRTIDENTIQKYLWTSALGERAEVDLVIRTSGEQRVSNFLLWQSAYAEYVFFEKCWPEFSSEDFRSALGVFSTRQRRFGQVSEQRQAVI